MSIDLETELREFKEHLDFINSKDEMWYYTESKELPSHDFNFDIIEPVVSGKTEVCRQNQYNNTGAVGIRVDDDFLAVATLPYKFKDLTIEQIVAILWSDIEEPNFKPAHGSKEQADYCKQLAKDQERMCEAYRKNKESLNVD